MKQIYTLLAGIVLLASSCSEIRVEGYTDRARLYFFRGSYLIGGQSFIQRDSLAQSFFIKPAGQDIDTVYIEVRTMGPTADSDRPFRLEQTNVGEADAAVPGTHYIGFDDERAKKAMVIPAGAVSYRMPLYMLRKDPRMDTQRFRLRLRIAENEYFGIGADTLPFSVTTTAMADKPPKWDSSWKYAFGNWGAKKMWFIMEYIGIRDFIPPAITDNTYYKLYLNKLAKRKLEEYNADESHADRPLREADGNLVEF